MGRSVLAGLLMGTILGGAIAATLSLQAAPPGEKLAAVKAAGAAPADAAGDEPAALEAPEAVAEAQPEVEAAPEAADTAAPAPETPVVEVPAGSEFAQAKPEEEAATPETEAPAEAATAPVVSAPAAEPAPDLAEVETAAQPEGQTEAPQAPEAPAAAETAAADLPAAEEQAAAADAVPSSEPAAADAAPAETAPAAEGTASAEATQPAAEPAAGGDAGETVVAEAPETAPSAEPSGEQVAAAEPAEPTLPGTKVDQLPTIGAEASAAAPADEPALSEEELAALPPLVRYAAPFDRAGVGPTVSIVLLDVGEGRGGLDATAIQAISFPVTIALDAASANARERAADYRKAGFEIAIMAGNSLQRGMDAKDVAVAVESFVTSMPEAVAVIPAPDALFQIDRTVVRNLADALKADGLGLLTYARGLNVAGQAAESAGVPHASASRVVDEYKEDAATVRKALEKAAFEAGQKGSVVIVAHAYPETLKALFDWVAAGPEGVTLAPASAPMIATRAGQ